MANLLYKDKKIKAKQDYNYRNATKILFIIFVFLLVVVFFLYTYTNFKKSVEKKPVEKEDSEKKAIVSLNNSKIVIMNIPAVDSNGKGTVTQLVVEAARGSGKTLVDIDNLLFWADTQQSIRIAKNVAANITQKNIYDYDLVYTIYVNASLIGGPSAGAALTLSTIAALEGKNLAKDVMITGIVNHDGSIGPVGDILEKAKAAKQANANLFLVPLLQSRDVIYETREHCEKFGYSEICTTETIPIKINVAKEANITIIEVSSVQEAMQYFF